MGANRALRLPADHPRAAQERLQRLARAQPAHGHLAPAARPAGEDDRAQAASCPPRPALGLDPDALVPGRPRRPAHPLGEDRRLRAQAKLVRPTVNREAVPVRLDPRRVVADERSPGGAQQRRGGRLPGPRAPGEGDARAAQLDGAGVEHACSPQAEHEREDVPGEEHRHHRLAAAGGRTGGDRAAGQIDLELGGLEEANGQRLASQRGRVAGARARQRRHHLALGRRLWDRLRRAEPHLEVGGTVRDGGPGHDHVAAQPQAMQELRRPRRHGSSLTRPLGGRFSSCRLVVDGDVRPAAGQLTVSVPPSPFRRSLNGPSVSRSLPRRPNSCTSWSAPVAADRVGERASDQAVDVAVDVLGRVAEAVAVVGDVVEGDGDRAVARYGARRRGGRMARVGAAVGDRVEAGVAGAVAVEDVVALAAAHEVGLGAVGGGGEAAGGIAVERVVAVH